MKRPKFKEVYDRLISKEAEGFIVTKIDRISRSIIDFCKIKKIISDNTKFCSTSQMINTSTIEGCMLCL